MAMRLCTDLELKLPVKGGCSLTLCQAGCPKLLNTQVGYMAQHFCYAFALVAMFLIGYITDVYILLFIIIFLFCL